MGSQLWSDRLAFRDHLRGSASGAEEYAALKEALAERHRFDREAYTEAKGEFIRLIGAEMRQTRQVFGRPGSEADPDRIPRRAE